MKKRKSLKFEVVEVPAPEGSLDDLLDFVADLVVKKWMEDNSEQKHGKNNEGGSKER